MVERGPFTSDFFDEQAQSLLDSGDPAPADPSPSHPRLCEELSATLEA